MKQITCEARQENLLQVMEFIDRELENAGCAMKAQMQIDVAVDELFSNVAQYAYAPGSGEVTVSLDFHPEDRMAEITFTDGGTPYDPLKKPDPDVTLSAEERQIGGLGIFLVKKTMDDMRYRYENGKNILTIVKKI